MKIKTRIIISLILFALICILITVLLYFTIVSLDKITVHRNISNQIQSASYEIDGLTKEFLVDPKNRTREQIQGRLQSLRYSLTQYNADDPEQNRLITGIKENIAKYPDLFSLAERMEGNEPSPAQSGNKSDYIRVMSENYAIQSQNLISDATHLSGMIDEEANNIQKYNTILLFSILVSFFAVVLINILSINLHILRSISVLQEGTSIIGRGNLDFLIHMDYDDELGDLSKAFNSMTRNLKAVTASKTELETAIAERIRAEEVLKEQNDELEALNAELTAMDGELRNSITNLAQHEKELAESLEKFHTIADFTYDWEYWMGPDGNFIYITPSCERITGYSQQEFIEDPSLLHHIVHPSDRDTLYARFAFLPDNREPSFLQYRIIRKDGLICWIDHISQPVFDRNNCFSGRRASNRDTTVQHLAEEKVRESEERLSAIVQGSPFPEFVIDKNHCVTHWNKALEEWSGIKGSDVIGTNLQWKAFYPDKRACLADLILDPDLNPGTAEEREGIISSGLIENAYEAEKFFPDKGNRGRWVHLCATPIVTRQGEMIGAVESFADITEIKHHEDVLATSLRLNNLLYSQPLHDLFQISLDETERLTGSRIGFFHQINEKEGIINLVAWSTETKKNCFVQEEPGHYPIEKAGVWIDCMKERIPVIHNEYESLGHKKKLPQGHVPIVRELVVPIFQGEEIVAIIGVGNKPSAYTENDVQVVQLIAENVWLLIQRRQYERILTEKNHDLEEMNGNLTALEEELRVTIEELSLSEKSLEESEERLKLAVESGNLGLWEWRIRDNSIKTNQIFEDITGLSLNGKEWSLERIMNLIHHEDKEAVNDAIVSHMEGETDRINQEMRIYHPEDGWRWFFVSGRVIERDDDGNPVLMVGLHQDISDHKKMVDQIHSSLIEKETLLKEIHHRVKNNIQVISSLLAMQARLITDISAKEALQESQNRVKSIAFVHELLYQSRELYRIRYQDYLMGFIQYLFSSYGIYSDSVSYRIDANEVYININQAVPCSLIINELITNSLKHAFPDGRKGQISIVITVEKGLVVVHYSDNGVGLPDNIDLDQPESLGMQLITGLTEQLGGTIETDCDNGTCFVIRFPYKNEMERRNEKGKNSNR